jgi:hypothetical protein
LSGLSAFWIALALTLPPLGAVAAAWPFWRTGQVIFGNIVGTVIIFGAAIGLIMREHLELDALVRGCLDQGVTCWPEPSAFTRFAIYAFIGLFEVIVLFSVSLKVEGNIRRRRYAPEWR